MVCSIPMMMLDMFALVCICMHLCASVCAKDFKETFRGVGRVKI